MTDKEFRCFLDLMMCSDPWPTDITDQGVMIDYANKQSRLRGFPSWIEAFHGFLK